MEERAQDGEYECNANASDAPGSGLWSPPPSSGKYSALAIVGQFQYFSYSITTSFHLFPTKSN